MKRSFPYFGLMLLLGLASLLLYLVAWSLQDLRHHTIEFLLTFFATFILYAAATVLVLKQGVPHTRGIMITIFGFAFVFNALLVSTPPTLSDDMYRYIWDGRVQAQGISPYRYPPDAVELVNLRDKQVWRFINRKSVVTVYPPVAEMVYALLWRIVPDSIRWFQVFMACMGLLAGGLLVGLLKEMGRSPVRVVIFLWSPLLIYEVAHSAHIDALILPLLIGAWWARLRERDGLTGLLLGLASAVKLFPIFLLPALWRPNHPQGRWRMPLAFLLIVLACYLPYLVTTGGDVVGFLPTYLTERFNVAPPLVWLLETIPHQQFADSQRVIQFSALGFLALVGLLMVLRPARDGESALRRCLWPISIFTLLNPNLFSWYLLWLLPLLAIFLESGQLRWRGKPYPFGLRLDVWTAWWVFCGLVMLSYTFFLDWETLPTAINIQFWPLYTLLGIALLRQVWQRYFQHGNALPPGGGVIILS
ncbi:glycosyltransferase 87 family protein [Chloroflexota bacterium]